MHRDGATVSKTSEQTTVRPEEKMSYMSQDIISIVFFIFGVGALLCSFHGSMERNIVMLPIYLQTLKMVQLLLELQFCIDTCKVQD